MKYMEENQIGTTDHWETLRKRGAGNQNINKTNYPMWLTFAQEACASACLPIPRVQPSSCALPSLCALLRRDGHCPDRRARIRS